MTTEPYFADDTMLNTDAEEIDDDAIADMDDFDDEDEDGADELGALEDVADEM